MGLPSFAHPIVTWLDPHSKDPSYVTPYERFFRFSFGPLLPETFEDDVQLFREVYEEYKRDVGIASEYDSIIDISQMNKGI